MRTALSHSVTVADADFQASYFLHGIAGADHAHSEFTLQITFQPPVVIAGIKDQFHSAVGKSRQRAEHAHETTRSHVTVFCPEIEHIAENVQCLRIFRQIMEIVHEQTLPQGGVRTCPEMHIRYEIIFAAGNLHLEQLADQAGQTDYAAIDCKPLQFRTADKGDHHPAGENARNECRQETEYQRHRADT